jgi:hypothetical protein
MALRMEAAEQFAHRMNIAKYRRILATYLTAQERRFVECRLAEEQAAYEQLAENIVPEGQSIHAA